MVNAIAHIHIKPPRLTKQGFVAGAAAAIAVAGGFLLGIRLRFHNYAPQQLASGLAFHQQAADELGGNLLGGAGEEGLGEVLGELGGYGSGLGATASQDLVLIPGDLNPGYAGTDPPELHQLKGGPSSIISYIGSTS